VVLDGHVLGKPVHPEEAKSMLRRLSGTTNEVLTAVALARMSDTLEVSSEVSSTLVKFLIMTEEEIADYVNGGEPMDKAGAYALNGEAAIFIESVHGSPTGVVGLPLHVVARMFRRAGLDLLSFR
jgi:septum formation protein